MSPPLLFQTTIFYLLVFASKASSQIVGCDTIGCGKRCPLGNITAYSIGITSFNASFSPQPLTWTIGFSSVDVPEDSSNETYQRSYFFGTPPNLNLTNSTASFACALFFEGLSQIANTTDGSCEDSLGKNCAADLLSQAQSVIDGSSFPAEKKRNVNTTEGSTSQCEVLQATLQSSAPKSCTIASGQNWGTISVRDLTGTNAPSIIPPSTCHATTGADYDLSLVDTYATSVPTNNSIIATPFVMGTTPILTIFRLLKPSNGSSLTSEAHLSCLKVIPSDAGEVDSANLTSTATRFLESQGRLMSMGLGVVALWNWML